MKAIGDMGVWVRMVGWDFQEERIKRKVRAKARKEVRHGVEGPTDDEVALGESGVLQDVMEKVDR